MLSTTETKEGQKIGYTIDEETQSAKNDVSLDNKARRDDSLQKSLRTEESTSLRSMLLACCSEKTNMINIFDLEKTQSHANFKGVQIRATMYSWTHVKEIPNSKLLVSLHHDCDRSANMEIFDVSKKNHIEKIYSHQDVLGVTGFGDVANNARRGLLGALPLERKVAYHLFSIGYSGQRSNYNTKLLKKVAYKQPCDEKHRENHIIGLDFSPSGELGATIDSYGVCLISDVNSNTYRAHQQLSKKQDWQCRCRWGTNVGDPFVFVKYDGLKYNIIDAEKNSQLITTSSEAELGEPNSLKSTILWIDVCPTNGNLMASCGYDKIIKIFDKRELKVVETFKDVHSKNINCVRWSQCGDMLVTGSDDTTAKLLDFKTGKVIQAVPSADKKAVRSACVL